MATSLVLDGMTLRIAGLTDTGMKRSHNEDYLYTPTTEHLVMVADGMGGHASGDVASRLAVETVVEFFEASKHDRNITWPFSFDRDNRREENRLVTGIKLANLKIYETAQANASQQGMGTTLVAGLFCDDDVILGHVGDSRIYRIRDESIEQLSEDHSLVNDYIKMKRIKPEDAENFPQKNVIVRALGMKDTVTVDVQRQKPRIGDIYLFCSDGLSGMISDEMILHTVSSSLDLDRACASLIEAANNAGGVDNITAALVRLDRA